MMISSNRRFLMSVRNCALLGLLITAFVLGGCSSCKEYKDQVIQLDSQIADLQQQVAEKENSLAEANQMADDLRARLAECENAKQVLVDQMNETVMIRIPDKLMFASGTDMILETMIPTLEAIAGSIREHSDWDVYVEGYTDSQKILEDYHFKWPSNWELGASRACAVVRYLTNQQDLPAERFAAVSYGPFRPVGDNATAEGREANRFVQVIVHKPER